MSLAIQTNVWFDRLHRSDLPRIVEQIARAGYDALEIGGQRLNLDAPDAFLALTTQHRLAIAGIHTGGEIYTFAEMRARKDFFESAIRFARNVNASCVLLSGKPKEGGKTDADLATEVDSLNWVADLCQSQGMPLNFHTHNWELADDLRELRFLTANTDPEKISLCLDIGWVQRAGYDPLKLVDEFYPRIRYLHLKDTLEDRFTEVGRGTVDFRALLSDLKRRGFSGQLAVERDEELENAFESARISREALRDLGV